MFDRDANFVREEWHYSYRETRRNTEDFPQGCVSASGCTCKRVVMRFGALLQPTVVAMIPPVRLAASATNLIKGDMRIPVLKCVLFNYATCIFFFQAQSKSYNERKIEKNWFFSIYKWIFTNIWIMYYMCYMNIYSMQNYRSYIKGASIKDGLFQRKRVG